MKFSFYTLGCKVNQYETQAMQQMLLSHGHTLGEFDEPCDGYIVNSCVRPGNAPPARWWPSAAATRSPPRMRSVPSVST